MEEKEKKSTKKKEKKKGEGEDEDEGKERRWQANVERGRKKKSAIQELARTHEKTQVVATH